MAFFFTDGQFWSDVGSNALGLGTRALGVAQAAGGGVVAFGGGALCTTGVGCVIGAPLVVIGADQAVAGARTAYTGEFKDSLLATGAGEVAKLAGVSEQTAGYVTTGTDMVAGVLTPTGVLKVLGREGLEAGAEAMAKEGTEALAKSTDEISDAAKAADEAAEEATEEAAENGVKVTEDSAAGSSTSEASSKSADQKASDTKTAGEPISMLTGEELLELNDFNIESPITFSWKRLYRSSNNEINGLGVGWTHRFSDYIEITEAAILWHDDENRCISFPLLELGASHFHPTEKCTMSRQGDELICLTNKDRVTHHFFNANDQKYLLVAITDQDNNRIDFHYDDSSSLATIEAISDQGRRASYEIERNENRQITSIHRIDPQSKQNLQTLVEYIYDELHDLIAFTDPVNQGEQYVYQNHIIISRRLRSGYIVNFEWDQYTSQGKCIRQWGDRGFYHYEFSWNDRNGYNTCRNANGVVTKYKHDAQGKLVEEIDGEGHSHRKEYNKHGWLTKVIDPMGHTTFYSYDDRGNIISTKDALGQSTQAEFNSQDQLTTYTDPRGHQWQQFFNSNGKLSQSIDPLGATTEWYYDSQKLPIHIVYDEGIEERLVWNAQRQLERSAILSETGESTREFRYFYDQEGRIEKITYPDLSIASLKYDALDRLIYAKHNNQITEYDYDGLDRLILIKHDDGSEEKLRYDSMGGLSFYQDKMGAITQWYYADNLSQPSKRINADGRIVNYEYDGERNLTALINENGVRHELQYDNNDRVIVEKGFDGRCQRYRYNAAGQLIHNQDEDGRELNFVRDAMGQLREVDDSDGQVSYYRYNQAGAILEAETVNSIVQFLYDPVGNLLREQQGNAAIQHSYDGLGRRVSTMTPNGKTIDYQYELGGGLQEVTFAGRQVTHIQHDALGRVQQQQQGGLTTCADYDPQGRLSAINTYRNYDAKQTQAKPILATDYQYNRNGYVEQINDISRGTTQYHYDKRERLVSVKGVGKENFAFDPAGNILGLDTSIQSTSQNKANQNLNTHHSGNRLSFQGDRKFEYDLSGNLIKERRGKDGCRVTHFTYNAQNQLIRVDKEGQLFEFDYDAFGRRIRKRDRFGETVFLWNGDVLLSESRKNYHRTYLFLPESFTPLAFVQDDAIYHYQTDHIGTPQEVTNDEGEVVWQVRYSAYGSVVKIYEEKIENSLRFQGQYYDADLGLHYNRHRYYDPSVGRYISQDPIGLLGGENSYTYSVNPIGWVDPLGLKGEGGGGKDLGKGPITSKSDFDAKYPESSFPATGGHSSKELQESAWKVYQDTSQGSKEIVMGRLVDTEAGEALGMQRLSTNAWSMEVNRAWIQGGVDAKRTFYLGSNSKKLGNLRTQSFPHHTSHPYTVTYHELKQLKAAGYTRVGDYIVPPG